MIYEMIGVSSENTFFKISQSKPMMHFFSSISFRVFIAERLKFILNGVLEALRCFNDLTDDLTTSRILILFNLVLKGLPLANSAPCNQTILIVRLTFDLFNEECDHFVDGILVLVENDLKRGANGLIAVRDAVVFDHAVHVLAFNPLNKVLLLLVQLLLELDAESDELRGDVTEDFSLQGRHLFVDLLDLAKELSLGGIQCLLESHLDVHKVALECLDQINQLVLLPTIVFKVLIAVSCVLGSLLEDVSEDVLLCLLVHLNLRDALSLGQALSIAHLAVTEVNLLRLLLLFSLDVLLELSQEFLNVGVRVLEHIVELAETMVTGDHIVVFERFATVKEQVLSVMNVCFSE